MSNFFFGGLPTLGQRWAAGQKAVGPTSAAIVGPTNVPTLAQRLHAIWVVNKLVEKGVQWEILSMYEKLEFCMNKSNVIIFSNYLRQIFEIRKTCILQ